MNLLVIDTTGPACSVALRVPGRADLVCSENMPRGQAERLAPMVSEVLAQAGLVPRQIDRIGVTTGPGSFAGTRVGVAFARGLALATGAESVGISNFRAWVKASDPDDGYPVIAAHDAKRGEVVFQKFECGNPAGPPQTLPVEEFRKYVKDALQSGDPVFALSLVGSAAPLAAEGGSPGATASVDMGAVLDLASQAEGPFDPPRPFYARPPDAKLPGGQAFP